MQNEIAKETPYLSKKEDVFGKLLFQFTDKTLLYIAHMKANAFDTKMWIWCDLQSILFTDLDSLERSLHREGNLDNDRLPSGDIDLLNNQQRIPVVANVHQTVYRQKTSPWHR